MWRLPPVCLLRAWQEQGRRAAAPRLDVLAGAVCGSPAAFLFMLLTPRRSGGCPSGQPPLAVDGAWRRPALRVI
jgi:hypothetical protein